MMLDYEEEEHESDARAARIESTEPPTMNHDLSETIAWSLLNQIRQLTTDEKKIEMASRTLRALMTMLIEEQHRRHLKKFSYNYWRDSMLMPPPQARGG